MARDASYESRRDRMYATMDAEYAKNRDARRNTRTGEQWLLNRFEHDQRIGDICRKFYEEEDRRARQEAENRMARRQREKNKKEPLSLRDLFYDPAKFFKKLIT